MPPAFGSPSKTTQVIAERREIARDGQRGRAAADEGDALSVFRGCGLGQAGADVVLVVGGDALQAADRHRLLLHAHAAAGRFARPVAGAPKNPGKHVGLPVDHVGVAVAACRDQADVFGNRRMRRAGPLAIDDFVEVIGGGDVSVLHYASHAPQTRHAEEETASHPWRRIGSGSERRIRAAILKERAARKLPKAAEKRAARGSVR